MQSRKVRNQRRGTVLLMIVGLLAMLFMIVTAYITLARFDRLTLAQVGAGDRVAQILDSVDNVLVTAIAQGMIGPDGNVDVGGPGYQDIPGYGQAQWLSSPLVRDVATDDDYYPGQFRYPAVTGLGGPAVHRSLPELMFDHPEDPNSADPDDVAVVIDPWNPAGDAFLDTLYNARWSFMDADGDGIADSYFGDGDPNTPDGGVALLTELANAMAGSVVRTLGVNPARIYQHDDWQRRWQHFDNQAQYLVATRIVSHGGMISIGVPLNDDDEAWNRQFVEKMFRWVAHPNDNGTLDEDQIRAAWDNRETIEPLLRARGGLLIGTRAREVAPDALEDLQVDFPYTFVPQYAELSGRDPIALGNWQRFDLSSGTDWNIWRRARYLDPDEFNDHYGTSSNPQRWYVARQLLTVTSTSDELARNQSEQYPREAGSLVAAAPGIYPGQPKFYLGKIAAAFDAGNYVYEESDSGYDGYEIVKELASYYYEMLAAYKNWGSTGGGGIEAVSRLEQAYMLAVNTVAFAAPRAANGQPDHIYYYDSEYTFRTYHGYVPQPYFTQVVAYHEPMDPNVPESTDKYALAVELFNPHDRTIDVSQDLDLGYFAVSINDRYEAMEALPLPLSQLNEFTAGSMPATFEGRSFLTFVLRGTDGSAFFEQPDPEGSGALLPLNGVSLSNPVPVALQGDNHIVVKLWRRGHAADAWYLVDRIEVDPTSVGTLPTDEWYCNTRRDTTEEPSLGDFGTGDVARWRMVTAFEPGDGSAYMNFAGATAPSFASLLTELGQGDLFMGMRNAPAVPLFTMNAGANNNLYIHGAMRPASFPTAGFLLFVPRYAHMTKSLTDRETVGTLLAEEYRRKSYDLSFGSTRSVPADFGHMPVFDNQQEVYVAGEFPDVDATMFQDGQMGRVPWGLLVFDYFTTLDPADANGDGVRGDRLDTYRVQGRINVNTAPWNVLAGLPVIGPTGSGVLPLSVNAAPAFWSPAAGVLVGQGTDGTQRFVGNLEGRVFYDGSVSWWRLGKYLGQAAAAYRDRVAYTSNAPVRFPYAFARNDGGYYPYRTAHYGPMRGHDDLMSDPDLPESWQRGFLSIGELANVVGFDSSSDLELSGDAQYTVLGTGDTGGESDFMRAVSLMALLDSHFLTTRSNTFTVYVTLAVNDPESPQSSVRSQITVDRSNLLPHLVMYDQYDEDDDGAGVPDTPVLPDVDGDGDPDVDRPIIIRSNGLPETIGQREVAYSNTRFDE